MAQDASADELAKVITSAERLGVEVDEAEAAEWLGWPIRER
jgi:hypothetical protein